MTRFKSISPVQLSVLVSSATNLNPLGLELWQNGADGFSRAAMAMLILVVGLEWLRVSVTSSALVRGRRGRSNQDALAGYAQAHGMLFGGVVLTALVLARDSAGLSIAEITTLVVVPGLFGLDAHRYWSFAVDDGVSALTLDAWWFLASLAASYVGARTGVSGGAVLGWALAGVGVFAMKTGPRSVWTVHWRAEAGWGRSVWGAAETLADRGVFTAMSMFVPFVAGLSEFASLRAAQLAYSPTQVASGGLAPLTTTKMGSYENRPTRRLVLLMLAKVWIVLLSISITIEAILLTASSVWTSLGDLQLDQIAAIGIPLCVAYSIGGVSYSCRTTVHAIGTGRQSLIARLLSLCVVAPVVVLGTILAGAKGFAWSLACAQLAVAGIWTRTLFSRIEADWEGCKEDDGTTNLGARTLARSD